MSPRSSCCLVLAFFVLTSCQAPLGRSAGRSIPPGATAAGTPAGGTRDVATSTPPAPVSPRAAPPEDASAPALAAGPNAAATARPRLGVLAPFSGPYAGHGRAYLDGVRLAVEGRVAPDGSTLDIVPADDKAEAAGALQAVRRLDDSEKVTCIVGGFVGGPTWVAALECNWRGVPFLANVAHEPALSSIGPFVFHEGATPARAAQAAAELATFELRLFRAAMLSPDEGEGRLLASEFSARLAALGGRIVAAETYAPGTTDFSVLVRRLASADPDVLYLPVDAETMRLVTPALVVEGVQAQIIGVQGWNSERLLAQVGADLEGALVPHVDIGNDDRAALQRFDSAYRARHGGAPTRYATAGFLAAQRVLDALATLAAPDRPTLQAALLEAARARAAGANALRFLVVQHGALRPFPTP